MIRILVNGAFGKMGKQAVAAIQADAECELVGAIGRADDLATAIAKEHPDVVVDLTTAESVCANFITILNAGVRSVIGTSGLTQQTILEVEHEFVVKRKQKIAGLIVPNFSLGAVLMMKYAREIARYFSDVEIIEMHHAGKIDSPSGTALRTAELIAETRQPRDVSSQSTVIQRESVPHARGAVYQQIPIHSVRLPGLLAQQQVLFGGVGETLTLRHDTIDRACFMPGLLLACKKVMTLDRLVVGLEAVI